MSLIRPNFNLMRVCYETYKNDSAPCKYGYTNQCAIRMSLALVNNGFDLDGFPDQKRVHRGKTKCQLGDKPHVVGADELHEYLMKVWDMGLKGKGSEIKAKIQGKPGIVYFNNCFKRNSADTTKKGDHIDLWTGERYYNQFLHLKAGGDTTATSDLFSKAGFVRFFWLP